MMKGEYESTLLSGSESEDGEEVLYRQRTGHSSRKGTLMNRRITYSGTRSRGYLCKALLGISLLLNVILIPVIVLLIKPDVWDNRICPSFSPGTTSPSITLQPPKSQDSTASHTQHESNQLQQHQKDPQTQQQQEQQQPSCQPIPACGADQGEQKRFTKDQKLYQNIFADLTSEELEAVSNFLWKEPTLNVKQFGKSKTCSIFGIELHPPNKTSALLFLDTYGPRPAREAHVLLSCQHLLNPMLKEIVVGPLPNLTYFVDNPRRKKSTIPYRFHPTYGIGPSVQAVMKAIINNPDLTRIVTESYGATFRKCGSHCVTLLPQKTSSAYDDAVVVTVTSYYATEFTTINPLDLIFVTRELVPNSGMFHISNVFYGGLSFRTIKELLSAYDSGAVRKTRMSFPKPAANETSLPGSLNLRGPIFPDKPQAGPRSYEPDGKRYSINGQHVNYLKWSFNFRMSRNSGPQVWDVRWGEERIAYEISLQDVGVIYAGANPTSFFSHLSDSAFGLGNKASGLLPGLDCPEGATFLSQTVFVSSGTGATQPHSQCIFEHNTERPLRRHRNNGGPIGRSHGGVVDRVLIIRSILVEYNYDYIFDVVFHQNGAMELKTYATGYVMSQHFYNLEEPFGFRIHEHSVGSIHHHIFNFKIDLDILGTSNRYETLDLTVNEQTWPWYHKGNDTFKQISFKHNLKQTEMEAVMRYNYSNPKYHIVYNDEKKNKFGNHRAYRIDTKGFSKQILPDNSPVLNSRAWAKYEMLTTQRKDTEDASSSIFSMVDGTSPHVNIDWYLEDNETIVDQDLVFWITVGMHHIPHTEDIPNTPTLGTEAAILITPYNYFAECPSVGSRDSIRVDRIKEGKVVRIRMKDYGINGNKKCIPETYDYVGLFSTPSKLYTG